MREGKEITFLITKPMVDKVVETYLRFIEIIDDRCAESGCMCDIDTPEHSQWIKDELHEFETSLIASNYNDKKNNL